MHSIYMQHKPGKKEDTPILRMEPRMRQKELPGDEKIKRPETTAKVNLNIHTPRGYHQEKLKFMDY